jgi:glycosyltransferase involved in cell wall biosynthesis
MRVLEVASVFPPHVGGLEVCVYEVSKELVQSGHQVIVYSTNFPKSKTRECKDGTSIRRIPVLFTVFGAPVAIFLRYILKEEVDLINVHIPPIFGAFSSVIASRIKKIPIVLTFHSDTVGNSVLERVIAQAYNAVLNKFILRKANLVIVPSNTYRIRLARRGIELSRLKVIENGVDFSSIKIVDSTEIKRTLRLEGYKIVLFVGALEKRKGVEFLIRAVPRIIERIKNAKILIVGNGSQKKNLQNLAKTLCPDDAVHFTGYMPKEVVNALYAATDVFVLPSLHESFGLVLLEAMVRGKPVVASKISGIVDLVKPGFNGLLVEPKNPGKLAEAIVSILSAKDYAERLGKNGKAFSENFTWKKSAIEYASAFQECLNQNSNRRSMRR